MKNFILGLSAIFAFEIFNKANAEEGMPQLNPEFWPAQIFWLILVFFILYIISWKFLLPKIKNSIENRKMKVMTDLNDAQNIKEKAEKRLKEYEKIIDDSKNEAKKILYDAKKKIENDIKIKRKKFDSEIEKEFLNLENEIKNLKVNSIKNINNISTEISSEIIKELIAAETNISNVSAIVEDISKKKIKNYL
tara:strand:- start:21 stop:599 length:579 start_codon:yes stop_codon:yes gene_type:complete